MNTTPPDLLAGRVGVVFGATGWIGRAICTEFVRAGASIVMIGRDRACRGLPAWAWKTC